MNRFSKQNIFYITICCLSVLAIVATVIMCSIEELQEMIGNELGGAIESITMIFEGENIFSTVLLAVLSGLAVEYSAKLILLIFRMPMNLWEKKRVQLMAAPLKFLIFMMMNAVIPDFDIFGYFGSLFERLNVAAANDVLSAFIEVFAIIWIARAALSVFGYLLSSLISTAVSTVACMLLLFVITLSFDAVSHEMAEAILGNGVAVIILMMFLFYGIADILPCITTRIRVIGRIIGLEEHCRPNVGLCVIGMIKDALGFTVIGRALLGGWIDILRETVEHDSDSTVGYEEKVLKNAVKNTRRYFGVNSGHFRGKTLGRNLALSATLTVSSDVLAVLAVCLIFHVINGIMLYISLPLAIILIIGGLLLKLICANVYKAMLDNEYATYRDCFRRSLHCLVKRGSSVNFRLIEDIAVRLVKLLVYEAILLVSTLFAYPWAYRFYRNRFDALVDFD